MEIKLINKLSKELENHLFHWREHVFPIEGQGIIWAKSKWHLLAVEDKQQPSAHLGYGDFKILINNKTEKTVVGIGGVVVRPEAQGNGIPTKLFEFLHQSEHANNLSDTFTLFCPERLVSYYSKYNYKAYKGSFTFFQNGVRSSTDKLILMYRGLPLLADDIHIQGEPW